MYWGDGQANVAIYHDLGGPPWVQIVPLAMTRADGSTRTFGLNEAIAVLDPEYDADRPPSEGAALDAAGERAWLDWYARFLAERLREVVEPSEGLLAEIEARRPG